MLEIKIKNFIKMLEIISRDFTWVGPIVKQISGTKWCILLCTKYTGVNNIFHIPKAIINVSSIMAECSKFSFSVFVLPLDKGFVAVKCKKKFAF